MHNQLTNVQQIFVIKDQTIIRRCFEGIELYQTLMTFYFTQCHKLEGELKNTVIELENYCVLIKSSTFEEIKVNADLKAIRRKLFQHHILSHLDAF